MRAVLWLSDDLEGTDTSVIEEGTILAGRHGGPKSGNGTNRKFSLAGALTALSIELQIKFSEKS